MARKEKNRNVYMEVGNSVAGLSQSVDRSGSMNGSKYDSAINAFNRCNQLIYEDDSLYGSALTSYGVFGNKPELVEPLSMAKKEGIDFSKYPANQLTAYFQNRIFTGNYILKVIREAQKAGKTVLGWAVIDYTDGAATDDEYEEEAYRVTQKCREKGIQFIGVAIGDDCDHDTLNRFNDYVFGVNEPDKLEHFIKAVPLQIVKSVSQSVTGQTFTVNGTTIQGVAGIKEVTDQEANGTTF